jgi:hypothetical protein
VTPFLLVAICYTLARGAEDQDRTGDPSLFRGMLYQLSYLGEMSYSKLLNRSILSCRLESESGVLAEPSFRIEVMD